MLSLRTLWKDGRTKQQLPPTVEQVFCVSSTSSAKKVLAVYESLSDLFVRELQTATTHMEVENTDTLAQILSVRRVYARISCRQSNLSLLMLD